ncbi:Bud-site selection protein [Trametes coccinea BRFM310]|uniref:Bud-site selection protein n=1 Tax=Trametes coccinea (strain BRFM310) TaxID=1353009 RepID=A0A1Y2J362_TRAC3|nr:Bud-site selection protein [Trametes coccinea BRFM310]
MASQNQGNAVPRGTKRKRPTGEKPKGRPVVKRETPAELIPKKLHHGAHEVRKAAKKAVAFELRKLVKRLKTARGEKPKKGNVKLDDPAELERQLEILKHLDHEPFANTTLKTKILKDKLLSANEDVNAAVTEKLSENLVQPQEPGSSAAKVHARILSSKTIADAVHAVVESLREIVDPSLAKSKAKARSQEPEGEDEEGDEEDAGIDVDDAPAKGKKARLAAPDESDEETEEDAGSGSETEVDDAGWESGTVDGDEDGAGWESGTVDDGDDPRVASGSDGEESGSDDDSEDDADEDGDSPAEKPKVKAPPSSSRDPKGKAKAIGAESTFLPSLSVGFTRGDSDASDLSEADAEAAAADLPRKNRRGQRARRAIWEKKYGKNANHVKKQREEHAYIHGDRQRHGKGQGKGRDAREGGKPGAPPRGRGGPQTHRGPFGGDPPQRPPADNGWPKKQANAGAGQGGGGKKSDDKPLHPSWEAKRKLKEKLNPSIIPAQGKKIKFS